MKTRESSELERYGNVMDIDVGIGHLNVLYDTGLGILCDNVEHYYDDNVNDF